MASSYSSRSVHAPNSGRKSRKPLACLLVGAVLLLILILALWLTGIGSAISSQIFGPKETPTQAIEKSITKDPAAFVKPALDEINGLGVTGADAKDVKGGIGDAATLAKTLKAGPKAEADINGDDRKDIFQTYTVTSGDQTITVGAIALTNGTKDPVVLPSSLIGVNVNGLKLEAKGKEFDGTGTASTLQSFSGKDAALTPITVKASVDGAAASGGQKTAITVAAANAASDAGANASSGAAKAVDLGSLELAQGKSSAELAVKGNVAFGQPLQASIKVGATQQLQITGFNTDAQKGAAMKLMTADGQAVTVGADGKVAGSGDMRLIISSDAAKLAAVDSAVKLTEKPVAKTSSSSNTVVADLPTHTADGKPIAYFTFDDGPSQYTPQVLAILKKNNAHATFFEIGNNAKDDKAGTQKVRDAGDLIANHSWSHPQLSKLSAEAVRKEIVDTDSVLGKTSCMRPPYGATNSTVRSVIHDTGHIEVLWDVDTNDWKKPGVDSIVNTINKEIHPGAVVLMHDGGGTREQSVAALEKILPELAAKGYVFEAIPQCR